MIYFPPTENQFLTISCLQDIQLELLMEMYYQVQAWYNCKFCKQTVLLQARFTGSATARLFIYVTAYQF